MKESKQLRETALALIKQVSTISLATAKDERAWVAPVYYVYSEGAFYFFSDPETRHIREALDSRQASAAIYSNTDTWRGIQGIQMSGRIQSVGIGSEAIQALRAYIAKFPFTREFFESGQDLTLDNFRKRFRVRFYRFDPDLIYYLDNQIKFGFRKEILL
jgi:uncharacterized protein YhbP (UPF0306 family)